MNRKQNRKRKKNRQEGRQLSHAPRCAPLGGQIAAAHSSSTPCTARTSFPVFVFFRKRVAREEEGERELSSSRALSPFKNLKKKKKKPRKKKPSPSHRLRHRLELQCVPARVPEEHRPLLPRLPLKPQPRPQLAPDPSGRHPGGQLAELGHGEREAKVRHRDGVPVDRRGGGPGVVALDLVADELVAVEVEVDPGGAGAALGAAEGAVASFLGGWVGFCSSSGAGRSSARPRWSFFLPLFPGLVLLSLSLVLLTLRKTPWQQRCWPRAWPGGRARRGRRAARRRCRRSPCRRRRKRSRRQRRRSSRSAEGVSFYWK